MNHVDSEFRCLVAHYDEKSSLKPACIRCFNCRGWISPEDMDKECTPNPEAIERSKQEQATMEEARKYIKDRWESKEEHRKELEEKIKAMKS